MSLLKRFARQSRAWIFFESLGLVLATGLVDYASGYQVSMALVYNVPIFAVAWCCTRKDGLLIALLCGLTWWWADRAAGHPYPRNWIEGWETFVRVTFFLITAVASSSVRQQRDATMARIELLERSQALERQIIEISEREQQRIGQDLHDGICQYLAALSCAASSLKADLVLHRLPVEAHAAGELSRLLRDAVAQTRDLSRGLAPVQMDEAGLAAAVEELTVSATRLRGISCTYESVGSPNIFKNTTAVHLYRIAQEAINNAAEHGRARNVIVSLIDNRETTTLRIADDGAGISKTQPRGGGMGLSLMQYRARLAGGDLRIEEPPGGGTVVTCGIPTSHEELEKMQPNQSKRDVVLVEDHPMFREQLRHLIEKQPDMMVSGEADNARDGFDVIKEKRPALAIIDLTLKASSGLELLKDLRAQELDLPVLILSMHDESLYAERVLRAGANGYITKQEASEKVMEAIRQVLSGEIYLEAKFMRRVVGRIFNTNANASKGVSVERLTDRELAVFELIGEGKATREIAQRLRISSTTIDTYRARIKEKLGLENGAQLRTNAILWLQERHASAA